MKFSIFFAAALSLCFPAYAADAPRESHRKVITLDGRWEIAQGAMEDIPDDFTHSVEVPGLVDMAEPAFADVGVKSKRREAFWYRRKIQIKAPERKVALLKIAKAKYGTKVRVNGRDAGEHLACFTAGLFDVGEMLKWCDAENEIVVRVGAWRDSVPVSTPNGFDFEKTKYIPGIYDSVQLILTETPHIVRVQTVPDIVEGRVKVLAMVENRGLKKNVTVNYKVVEVSTGEVVGTQTVEGQIDTDMRRTFESDIYIENCRLWSPREPFLYELHVSTGCDSVKVRFGMRTFRFDNKTGRAMLNGKPYFMRGTNVCIFRFFEDPKRGHKPWKKQWVSRLHKKFRQMHWNSIRYCIGFPPEIWYEVADEQGFLIQDEFPIWYMRKWPRGLRAKDLVEQYRQWIQQRCNHPCVVIWDAQNETVTYETANVIDAVREFDLSHRPWENGWGPPNSKNDCYESHPYVFMNERLKPADLGGKRKYYQNSFIDYNRHFSPEHADDYACIINEYGWLWLNRDGTPTELSKNVYQRFLKNGGTVEKRRHFYARQLAAMTEFWRSRRKAAAVLHFCGLAYSRPDGQTSDNFLDVEQLEFEPNFQRYVGDAFSPVGIMIDRWKAEFSAGTNQEVKLVVINDLYEAWQGTISLSILTGKEKIYEHLRNCRIRELGKGRYVFKIKVPEKQGQYQLVGELKSTNSDSIKSIRDMNVVEAN